MGLAAVTAAAAAAAAGPGGYRSIICDVFHLEMLRIRRLHGECIRKQLSAVVLDQNRRPSPDRSTGAPKSHNRLF